MIKQERLTWKEMKKQFPDEWLLIIDCEHDKFGQLISGIIVRHSKDDTKVFQPPALKQAGAFKYTGESQFPGGWRTHAKHNYF